MFQILRTQTDGILQPSQKFALKIASSYLECASTANERERIVVFGWLCFETRIPAQLLKSEHRLDATKHYLLLCLSRNKMRLLQTMNARARRSGGQVLLWSKRRINLKTNLLARERGCGSAFVFALKVFWRKGNYFDVALIFRLSEHINDRTPCLSKSN
jgi:hypothetical protein